MNPVVPFASLVLAATFVRPMDSIRPRRPETKPTGGKRMILDGVFEQVGERLPFGSTVGPRIVLTAIGSAVVLAVVSLLLSLLPLVALMVVDSRRRRRVRVDAVDEIADALPEFIDLITLAVGSGLTPRLAISMIIPWLTGPFRAMAQEATQRSESGEPFATALESASAHLGPEARPLVSTLVASETDGAALLPALERVGDEARRRRRVAAEERARRIPVAMLFPLVLCVLPAFALLTVVPLLVGTLSDLRLPG